MRFGKISITGKSLAEKFHPAINSGWRAAAGYFCDALRHLFQLFVARKALFAAQWTRAYEVVSLRQAPPS
jgi:hypothetical protein